jgi:major type 1 subunit fimbrin (pilin)
MRAGRLRLYLCERPFGQSHDGSVSAAFTSIGENRVKKNYKLLVSAALAATALSAGTAHASDGTITINGKITAQTCDIGGKDGGKSFTVTLPTVSTGTFKGDGDTAGRTAFEIALSNCAPKTGNVSASFEVGAAVDTATSRLKNMSSESGAATQVQIQLLNADGTPIAVGKQAGAGDDAGAQGSKPVALDGSGAAKLTYAAQYVATGGIPTAGPVTTTVVYSIRYN